ncbi:hypothetical protein VFPPC_16660 [Pochonia chlamydosporia 170]|uniref:Uncharacterized protein n=1 Tax=Pochonia chlamydosporia 170 TaxID=1380566 RepID=A0A179FAA5_METCM|nr:hypothetical protein VFPPC_16660 [Pochonia chlamydosporia 170]OAQ62465.1 hypothetical protein VFPPC_16660 [Pochonia chlamydosporia 170]
MASMASKETATPLYFEESHAIISTIGLVWVLLGITIASIKGRLSAVLLVPIIVSAACALANGLRYIAYFGERSLVTTTIADLFAEFFYLIQETGLPFYGYLILYYILHGRDRAIFLTLFWVLMLVVIVIRVFVIINLGLFSLTHYISLRRFQTITRSLMPIVFVAVALIECITAVFLLRTLRLALLASGKSPLKGGRLVRYLMSSTEIRVASLALIGIARTATYLSQGHELTGGTNTVAIQVDMFIIVLQALFPITMFIDIITSHYIRALESRARSYPLSSVTGEGASAVWQATRQT